MGQIAFNGTAIADSSYEGYAPAEAFDNALGPYFWWTTCHHDACSGVAYIGSDFGEGNEQELWGFRIYQYPNIGGYTLSVTSVKVCYSDDGTNYTVYSTVAVGGVDVWSPWYYFTDAAPGKHRYWILLANSNPTHVDYSWCVIQVELRTNSISDSWQANGYDIKAFNGSTADNWQTLTAHGSTSGNAWVGYDFGVVTTEIRFVRLFQTTYFNITSIKVQSTADLTTWSAGEVIDVTDNSWQAVASTSAKRSWRCLANGDTSDIFSQSWAVNECRFWDTSWRHSINKVGRVFKRNPWLGKVNGVAQASIAKICGA